jgi:hypothetical protein
MLVLLEMLKEEELVKLLVEDMVVVEVLGGLFLVDGGCDCGCGWSRGLWM